MTAYTDHRSVTGQSLTLPSILVDAVNADPNKMISGMNRLADLRHAEYRFLFEFPSLLLRQTGDAPSSSRNTMTGEFAAAVLYRKEDDLRLLFFVWNEDSRDICVFEEADTPEHLVNFAWSFANILSVIPSGNCLTEQ